MAFIRPRLLSVRRGRKGGKAFQVRTESAWGHLSYKNNPLISKFLQTLQRFGIATVKDDICKKRMLCPRESLLNVIGNEKG